MANRAVIKLSGEQIGQGGGDSFYNDVLIEGILCQIKSVVESGTEVAIIVGGGNIWRGRSAAPRMNRVKADHIGMLATVMNGLYLGDFFRQMGVAVSVMTPVPFGHFTTIFQKEKAQNLMKNGTVVINAAGLGHPLFSTDTVTALRAAELEADIVLFAKTVDGVYTEDPRQNPDAKKYKSLSYGHAISNGLGIADTAALTMLLEAGILSYVFRLDYPDGIRLACRYPETQNLEGTVLGANLQEVFYGH